jgi:hypothetical protein
LWFLPASFFKFKRIPQYQGAFLSHLNKEL